MSVLVGADIQLFAGIEPAERADDILGAAELIVQNFRELARTGELGVRNLIGVDKSQ